MSKLKTLRYGSSSLILGLSLFFIGCAGTNNNTEATTSQPTNNNTTMETQMSEHPVVQLNTSMGDITVELYEDKAPKTVENFLNYVKSGQYENTIFHRVIPNFMIQGGGMDANMNEKPTQAPIENEADNGLKNEVGTIAMARTQDPHSATSQFFINTKDNTFLNHSGKNLQGWGYTVFGKVTSGMDVVEKIEGVKTGRSGMHADVPQEAITIESATVVSE